MLNIFSLHLEDIDTTGVSHQFSDEPDIMVTKMVMAPVSNRPSNKFKNNFGKILFSQLI